MCKYYESIKYNQVVVPAIEITKDGDFMCENEDYIVETPSSGRRSSHQHHQQVRYTQPNQ